MINFFDIIFPYFSGLLEVFLEVIFFGKFVGRRATWMQYVLFLALVFIVINLPVTALFKLGLFITILFLYGRFILRVTSDTAILYAVLTAEIMQLCFGVFNSLTTILASFLYEYNPVIFSYIFMIAGNMLSLGLSYLCYCLAFKYLEHKENMQNQYVLMILTPLLMIFVISEYINNTFYGNVIFTVQMPEILLGNHITMFVVQALGVVSIFTIVYAYQKLSMAFSISRKLSLLEQQSHFQKQYVEEAQAHYNSTRSIRHDMKNHILIVKGLLEKSDIENAKAYLDKMDIVTTNLSFPFQTNNPVLDVLLENKAALAGSKGIAISSTLKVPFPCLVGDMDFCIILSNALDNAIHACEKLNAEERKYIHISSSRQNDFLLLEIENSFNGQGDFKPDTGLSNIKWVAEKYGGAMDIGIVDQVFRLSVLLIISQ